MEFPCILFQTSENTRLALGDELSTVATQILEKLYEENRRATSLIEDELRKRESVSVPTSRVDKCLLRLRKDADLIKKRGRLDEKSLDTATGLLSLMTADNHKDRNSKVSQQFLTDVLVHCGPECTFLCAISLGKHKIANIREEERASLLQLLKLEKVSLSIEPFTSFAKTYGIFKLSGRFCRCCYKMGC